MFLCSNRCGPWLGASSINYVYYLANIYLLNTVFYSTFILIIPVMSKLNFQQPLLLSSAFFRNHFEIVAQKTFYYQCCKSLCFCRVFLYIFLHSLINRKYGLKEQHSSDTEFL